MTTQQDIISDKASLERQERLARYFETEASDWREAAHYYHQQNDSERRETCAILAAINAQSALRVRRRMLEIAERALTDHEQEPPRTLVGLTDWLVALLGRFFPGLPREGWQAAAYVLHTWRPQL